LLDESLHLALQVPRLRVEGVGIASSSVAAATSF
jgi:hypothetical protein